MIHICHLKQGYSWPRPTIHGLLGILGNRMDASIVLMLVIPKVHWHYTLAKSQTTGTRRDSGTAEQPILSNLYYGTRNINNYHLHRVNGTHCTQWTSFCTADVSGVKENTQKSKLGAQQTTDTIHIYNKYCHNNKYSSRLSDNSNQSRTRRGHPISLLLPYNKESCSQFLSS